MPTLILPSQLQALADGRRRLELRASTLGEALAELDREAPMLRSQLLEPGGAIRQFVGLFVDGQQLQDLGDGRQPLHAESELRIVLAVAGG